MMKRKNLYLAAAVLGVCGFGAVAACFLGGAAAAGAPQVATAPATPFRKNVKVEVNDKFMIVHCDGIPDHTTGDFPNRSNPNTIKKQDYTFKIPLHPQKADKVGKLPMGPIGIGINGVPLFVNMPHTFL